jgi:hypothetical protein
MRFLHLYARCDGQKFNIHPNLNHQIAAGGPEWNAARQNRYIFHSLCGGCKVVKQARPSLLTGVAELGTRRRNIFRSKLHPPAHHNIAISLQVESCAECKFDNVKLLVGAAADQV